MSETSKGSHREDGIDPGYGVLIKRSARNLDKLQPVNGPGMVGMEPGEIRDLPSGLTTIISVENILATIDDTEVAAKTQLHVRNDASIVSVTTFQPTVVGESISIPLPISATTEEGKTVIASNIELTQIIRGNKRQNYTLLYRIVNLQGGLFELMGYTEPDALKATYTKVAIDYYRLCNQAGISSHALPTLEEKFDSDTPLETRLENFETALHTILVQPVRDLEFLIPDHEQYKSKVMPALQLPADAAEDDVLRALYSLTETKRLKVLGTILNQKPTLSTDDNPTLRNQVRIVEESIKRSKIVGLAEFDKYYWKTFVRNIMEKPSSDVKRAGEFTAQGAFEMHIEGNVDKFVAKFEKTVKEVSMAGPVFFRPRKGKDSTDKNAAIEVNPVPVPFTMRYNTKNELETTINPQFYTEYEEVLFSDVEKKISKKKSITPMQKFGQIFTFGRKNGETTPLNVVKKTGTKEGASIMFKITKVHVDDSKDIPQNTTEFSNQLSQIQAQNELMLEHVPLVVQLVMYEDNDGNLVKAFTTPISNHMVTDGTPLAKEFMGRILTELEVVDDVLPLLQDVPEDYEQLRETLLALIPDPENEPEYGNLDSFSEFSALIPVQNILTVRKMFKEAHKHNKLVDENGNPIDPTAWGIGTFTSALYGRIFRTQAILHDVTDSDSIGSLGASENIQELLRQVLITSALLPEDPENWFFVLNDGRVELNNRFVETMNNLQKIYHETDIPEEGTAIVRKIFFEVPQILHGLNAKLSQNVLKSLASNSTGKLSITSVNGNKGPDRNLKISGGPAGIPAWQNAFMTTSAVDNGLTAVKAKFKDDQVVALNTLRDFVSAIVDWEQKNATGIKESYQKFKKSLSEEVASTT